MKTETLSAMLSKKVNDLWTVENIPAYSYSHHEVEDLADMCAMELQLLIDEMVEQDPMTEIQRREMIRFSGWLDGFIAAWDLNEGVEEEVTKLKEFRKGKQVRSVATCCRLFDDWFEELTEEYNIVECYTYEDDQLVIFKTEHGKYMAPTCGGENTYDTLAEAEESVCEEYV